MGEYQVHRDQEESEEGERDEERPLDEESSLTDQPDAKCFALDTFYLLTLGSFRASYIVTWIV